MISIELRLKDAIWHFMWIFLEKKAREAEQQIRTIAQKAREQHRQLLRTSTSILPALRDTKATSLREAM